jgi:hypothetical protein
MKKSLMISVAAAALLATTGFAAAQGMSQGGSKGAEPAPTAASPRSEGASPSAGSPMSKEAAPPSMSKESAAPATKNSAASDMKNSPAPKSGSTAQDNSGTKAMPQQAQDKAGTAAGSQKPATADSKTGGDTKATTTGNAATSATAVPPAEKQTQIVSAIKQEKVEEVTNVNFNISIGTAVPASVRYYPLPSRIVEIYPEWRGYDFILVRGKYIILRPRTREIVYIIEG